MFLRTAIQQTTFELLEAHHRSCMILPQKDKVQQESNMDYQDMVQWSRIPRNSCCFSQGAAAKMQMAVARAIFCEAEACTVRVVCHVRLRRLQRFKATENERGWRKPSFFDVWMFSLMQF